MSKKSNDLVSNRRAFHNYEILETYEAGIALLGTEIKSLRGHGGSLRDAYVIIDEGEAFLKNASIAPYQFAGSFSHEERRVRKLLLHKREIDKLQKATDIKGLTIVPLAMYLIRGRAKVKLGVARGKKMHDKRSALKERDQKRDVERTLKDK